MGRGTGAGNVSDEGGQERGEGQEQGAGRLGGTAGAQADRVQPWAVGARGEAKWALCRGCALRVLLMGAQQKT